jgi:hypothetical protein
LILTFGDSGKKPVACDTFGKRNKTLVISRPSTGFLEFRLPLVQRNLSIRRLIFAVAPFVITTSFSSFDFSVLKPKLHLTLDSNAHSINLILTGKYSVSIKKLGIHQEQEFRKVTFP